MEDVIEKAQLLARQYAVGNIILEKRLIQIEANSSDGFSVSLSVEEMEVVLGFGAWHQSFESREEALYIFEKCLSGHARLRDVTCLGFPYKGILEIYKDDFGELELGYVNGLLSNLFLFPFPKKEKIYGNSFQKLN